MLLEIIILQSTKFTDTIEKALENKKVCSAIFLDVSHAFDKVWHKGVMIKWCRTLPKSYYDFLYSCLEIDTLELNKKMSNLTLKK